MNSIFIALLVATAGLALVVQNAIMLGLGRALGGIVPALWVNSIVGVAVLSLAMAQRGGFAPVFDQVFAQVFALKTEHLRSGAWHLVLPGLLGTYFVACSLLGYRSLGAATTIALLVASQLAAGLIYDSSTGTQIGLGQILGAGLLVAGAALVRLG